MSFSNDINILFAIVEAKPALASTQKTGLIYSTIKIIYIHIYNYLYFYTEIENQRITTGMRISE